MAAVCNTASACQTAAYTVNLHFAEIYNGCFTVGCRVFNVLVQGNTVFSKLDVFAQVGGNAALAESTTAR